MNTSLEDAETDGQYTLTRRHVPHVDSFYTGVPQAHQFLNRLTRVEIFAKSQPFTRSSGLHQGENSEIVAHKSGQIMVSKWKDKRDGLMLSTTYAGKIIEGSKRNSEFV